MDKITFTDNETGENQDFYILEETEISGRNYLLALDRDPDDPDALSYVFEKTADEGEEAIYTQVDDEETLRAILKVFSEILGDTDFIF